ncbi:MAG: hypothetical protein AAFN77_15915 [Planctomycetota bacterium]
MTAKSGYPTFSGQVLWPFKDFANRPVAWALWALLPESRDAKV